jgi:hypothetical protein
MDTKKILLGLSVLVIVGFLVIYTNNKNENFQVESFNLNSAPKSSKKEKVRETFQEEGLAERAGSLFTDGLKLAGDAGSNAADAVGNLFTGDDEDEDKEKENFEEGTDGVQANDTAPVGAEFKPIAGVLKDIDIGATNADLVINDEQINIIASNLNYGISTQSTTNKNASRDIRGDIPIPKSFTGPFLNSAFAEEIKFKGLGGKTAQ